VPRRDEGREVVEAIAVETPDERPDDLPDRRESHDRERLESDGSRLEDEEYGENERGEHAEPELSAPLDVPVGREHGDDGRDDRHEGQERKTKHRVHLRRNGGRRFDRGTQGATSAGPIDLP